MTVRDGLVRFGSFWIFPILSIVLLVATRNGGDAGAGSTILLLAGGLLLWTFLEYLFHRFLLHGTGRPAVLSGSHPGHHRQPRDPDQILVNPFLGVVISSVFYVILWLALGSAFRAAALLSGIWVGFLYYEFVHYRVHMSLAHSWILQRQRRAHFYHHFSNSRMAFGVTSPLWDYVFGTARRG